jgi:hypothetical protein
VHSAARTRIVEDDDVCGVQVDAQPTGAGGQQEHKLVAALLQGRAGDAGSAGPRGAIR